MMISNDQLRDLCSRALDGLNVPVEISWVAPYTGEVVLEAVSMVVAYDHARSWELSVSLRQQRQEDPAFELADVLRVTPCPKLEVERFALMQSGDPAVLERLLHAACESLARYGGEFLRGSPEAFDRARRVRSQRASEFTERVNDAPILRTADETWHRRDMKSVAEVLGPLRARLSNRDKRRLEYALRTADSEGQQP